MNEGVVMQNMMGYAPSWPVARMRGIAFGCVGAAILLAGSAAAAGGRPPAVVEEMLAKIRPLDPFDVGRLQQGMEALGLVPVEQHVLDGATSSDAETHLLQESAGVARILLKEAYRASRPTGRWFHDSETYGHTVLGTRRKTRTSVYQDLSYRSLDRLTETTAAGVLRRKAKRVSTGSDGVVRLVSLTKKVILPSDLRDNAPQHHSFLHIAGGKLLRQRGPITVQGPSSGRGYTLPTMTSTAVELGDDVLVTLVTHRIGVRRGTQLQTEQQRTALPSKHALPYLVRILPPTGFARVQLLSARLRLRD